MGARAPAGKCGWQAPSPWPQLGLRIDRLGQSTCLATPLENDGSNGASQQSALRQGLPC